MKLVLSAKRATGLAPEELRDRPAPPAPEGSVRFTRSLVRLGGYRRGEPPYDVVYESWFAAGTEPETVIAAAGRLGTWPDIAPGADVLIAEEHVVVNGSIPVGGVKNIEFVTRRPDLPDPDFRRYWRENHGPLAARIAVIRRYEQNHALPQGAGWPESRWDGLALTWFDDLPAMRASATTTEYAATRADEPNFLSTPLPFLILDEEELT